MELFFLDVLFLFVMREGLTTWPSLNQIWLNQHYKHTSLNLIPFLFSFCFVAETGFLCLSLSWDLLGRDQASLELRDPPAFEC